MTAPKPCSDARCPADAVRNGRCQAHATSHETSRRGTAAQRGYDRRWRNTADAHKADNPACTCDGCSSCLRPPGATSGPCVSPRLETHHLDDLGPLGPAGHDHDNLSTLCHDCHWRETIGATGHNADIPHRVTVITGPPCSGKTTYVNRRRQPDDLTVDYDHLMAAITGHPLHHHLPHAHPYVAEARDAIIRRLRTRRPTDPTLTAWVVTTQATPSQLNRWKPWTVIALPTPADICHQRARDQRPDEWHDGIDRWWNDWTPGSNGEHVQVADIEQLTLHGGDREPPPALVDLRGCDSLSVRPLDL